MSESITNGFGARSADRLSSGHTRRFLRNMVSGFSLVEVTLALGIVSFCLISVFGLLPVGLKSVRNANEQAGAANIMQAIAESLRSASSTNQVNFSNGFSDRIIQYSISGPATNLSWNNLTLEGYAETPEYPKRLSAVLQIVPPANRMTAGRATISVAWSAQASPTWNAADSTWAKADGSMTTGIQFLPKP